MLQTLIAAVLLSVSWAKSDSPPHRILLKTGDGWAIHGVFIAPAKGKAVALLIHGAGSSRNEWAPFAHALMKRGIGSVAIDLRGHGKSTAGPKGKRDFRSFAPRDWIESVRDIEAAAGFLAQGGFPGSRIILVGASVGANIAAMAAPSTDAHALVLLSPGLNYLGVLLPTDFEELPVLTVAARSDPPAWQASQLLKKQGVPFYRAPSGHGVNMLRDPALMKKVLRWVANRAAPPPPTPKTAQPG